MSIKVDRKYTKELFAQGKSPLDSVEWKTSTAEVRGKEGLVFKQENVEHPAYWKDSSIAICAHHYLRSVRDIRETSFKQAFQRVAQTIASWGRSRNPDTLGREPHPGEQVGVLENRTSGYVVMSDGVAKPPLFETDDDRQAFEDELLYMLTNGIMAFNSPVWYNVGVNEKPQCSACFILQVDDSMQSIQNWILEESKVFQGGSGAGVNLSRLRGSMEYISGSPNRSSGPMSFANWADAGAGAIKSGGKNRRAAKMLVMNVDHPDILEFIEAKMKEEDKGRALVREGYSAGVDGEVYNMLKFQNANNSVRITDEFMRAVEADDWWALRARTANWDQSKFTVIDHDGVPMTNWRSSTEFFASRDETPSGGLLTADITCLIRARVLWNRINKASWSCADPGLQFHDEINRWNTTLEVGEIEASNPCCFVGDTLIDTAEGKMSFRQLHKMSKAGKKLPLVFCWDTVKNLPALRKINKVWIAGKTKKLVEVTTDTGMTFRCTPEHRWILRNGDELQAKDLEKGMRLRKIGRWSNEERSGRLHINHRETKRFPNGTVIQARFMWEQAHGKIAPGYEVHHKNEDPTDDRLSNFELKLKQEHLSEHASGKENARYLRVTDSMLLNVYEGVEKKIRAKAEGYQHTSVVTPSTWNRYVRERKLVSQVPIARCCYKSEPAEKIGRIRGMWWTDFAEMLEGEKCKANDKVRSVKKVSLEKAVSVYDMEVDGCHTFAVTTEDELHSLVVHNSEYMQLNNTSCNLASQNLMHFVSFNEDNSFHFKADEFAHSVRVTTIAMELLIDQASYPSAAIEEGTRSTRSLGQGLANLGAVLMSCGIPYDSDYGREVAEVFAATLLGVGYATSADIAEVYGPYARYQVSEQSQQRVMRQHYEKMTEWRVIPEKLRGLAQTARSWMNESLGRPVRNAQISVMAPTGTISFLLQCDTTGIEPAMGLKVTKNLAGGGYLTLTSSCADRGLRTLGYGKEESERMEQGEPLESILRGTKFIDVFDCALPRTKKDGKDENGRDRYVHADGGRVIQPEGHIRMLAAIQKFTSGAISKTVNLPSAATEEDVADMHMLAWKLNLKAVALFRDGCKIAQPHEVQTKDKTLKEKLKSVNSVLLGQAEEQDYQGPDEEELAVPFLAERVKLPDVRHNTSTFKIQVGTFSFYVNVGRYGNGLPGEVFISGKEGSTIGGLLSAIGRLMSISLQHGVPFEPLLETLAYLKFEPSGFTNHNVVKIAHSPLDAMARILAVEESIMLPGGNWEHVGKSKAQIDKEAEEEDSPAGLNFKIRPLKKRGEEVRRDYSQVCSGCGDTGLERAGSCYRCTNCGETTGCGG